MIRTLVVVALALAEASSAGAGASPADRAVAAAQEAGRATPSRAEAWVDLALAFGRKAQETADGAWYRRAAQALDRATAIEPASYPALRTRAWILLGVHDFRAALATAAAARRREPRDWWNYATMADAAVELGRYALAECAVDRLLALRPGLPGYLRAGWLRALRGDRDGALALFQLAVAAGSPADPESLAWALVHLGHEQLAGGDVEAAARSYERALAVVPDHPLALGGLGRARAAEGRLAEAIAAYERAVARVPSLDVLAALGDTYLAAGDVARAEARWADVEAAGRVAAAAGGTSDRELALFLADHDRRPAEAVRLAAREIGRRDDVWTADVLAWALLKAGRPRPAARWSHRALRLGTADARLHYHAALIDAANGRTRVAARHIERALAINPYFDLHGTMLARERTR